MDKLPYNLENKYEREHPGCADWGDVLMTMFFEMTGIL